MDYLIGQTVFITGASSGIGAACAEAFAKRKCRVLMCARRMDKLAALADTLKTVYHANVHAAELDVSDSTAVHQFLHGLPDEWQEIDILINNAGKALGLGASFNQTLAHIDGMLDTNPVRGTKSSPFCNSLPNRGLREGLFFCAEAVPKRAPKSSLVNLGVERDRHSVCIEPMHELLSYLCDRSNFLSHWILRFGFHSRLSDFRQTPDGPYWASENRCDLVPKRYYLRNRSNSPCLI